MGLAVSPIKGRENIAGGEVMLGREGNPAGGIGGALGLKPGDSAIGRDGNGGGGGTDRGVGVVGKFIGGSGLFFWLGSKLIPSMYI